MRSVHLGPMILKFNNSDIDSGLEAIAAAAPYADSEVDSCSSPAFIGHEEARGGPWTVLFILLTAVTDGYFWPFH